MGEQPMKNWSVRQRILVGFSVVFAIMFVLTFFAYWRLRDIESRATALNQDSVPGLQFVGELRSVSIETFTSTQQYVLESDPAAMSKIMEFVQQKTVDGVAILKELDSTADTAQEREALDATKAALAPYMDVRTQVLKLSTDPKTKAQAAILLRDQLNPLYNKLQDAVEAEVEIEKSQANEAGSQIQNAVASAQKAILDGLLIGLILSVISAYLVIQAVNKSLTKLVSVVDTTRNGNQQQLSTANEIAATTAEIGATSKQISVTSKELVRTMKAVAEVAEKTTALANSGQLGLARMKVTVQQIVEASASIQSRLEVLNEKAGNIGAVITTIIKVADQTNLLSLNAAIEAEKAGDYGRGFAVVATEIRRLADQTAAATGDIEQTVKEMQSAVAAGVMGMDKFSEEVRRGVEVVQQVSEELSQIIQQVQTLAPNFETVSEGMQSQSLGAQQISDSLSQLSEAAKQTVDSMHQSNRAVEQLNQVARMLHKTDSGVLVEA
jgi:methyl-accepting chemotaxis protein WspA